MTRVLVRINGAIVFTRNYTHGVIFTTTYAQGSSGIVTRIRRGWFTTTLDIRLKDGRFLRGVPLKYFET